jgi:hypothetical protein
MADEYPKEKCKKLAANLRHGRMPDDARSIRAVGSGREDLGQDRQLAVMALAGDDFPYVFLDRLWLERSWGGEVVKNFLGAGGHRRGADGEILAVSEGARKTRPAGCRGPERTEGKWLKGRAFDCQRQVSGYGGEPG